MNGFLIFMNTALIQCIFNKQPTIDTSVFGIDFVVMKHGMETLRVIQYKLNIMQIPTEGPSYIYGDNVLVIHNTQIPKSTIRKKSNSIYYHDMIESVTMGEPLMNHIPKSENCVDLLKNVFYRSKRRYHVIKIIYDIYDDKILKYN